MRTRALLAAAAILLCPCLATAAPDAVPTPAAAASNQFGLDLHRCLAAKPGAGNTLISPLALHSGLTMLADGAAGKTLAELVAALHLGSKPEEMSEGVAEFRKRLAKYTEVSASQSEMLRKFGRQGVPIPLRTDLACRVFGSRKLRLTAPYLDVTKNRWDAAAESLDFAGDPDGSRSHINSWVSGRTQKRIPALLPPGSVDALTELVLVSALYFKGTWETQFAESETAPLIFNPEPLRAVEVPTMHMKSRLGFKKTDQFTTVALPYRDSGIQLLLMVPDAPDGLVALEHSLTSTQLGEFARLSPDRNTEVELFLPKFKIQPATADLAGPLKSLGLEAVFDHSVGGANFSRLSASPVYLRSVYHQAWLSLDEMGTEAAAAASSGGGFGGPPPKTNEITVRADHPFLFAIQDIWTGACLFLGRVTDPKF